MESNPKGKGIEQLLTIDETSALLKISKGSLYNMIHEGRIPVVKVGKGRVRFKPSSLQRWIDSMEKKGRITRRIIEENEEKPVKTSENP